MTDGSNRLGRIVGVSATLALASHAIAAPPPSDIETHRWTENALAQLGVRDGTVFHLPITVAPCSPLSARVPIDGAWRWIDLEPNSVRASTYQLFEQDSNGALQRRPPGVERTLSGAPRHMPGVARGALLEDGLYAAVRLRDGSVYWIEPLHGRVADAPPDTYVCYANADVMPPEGNCGNEKAVSQVAAGFRSRPQAFSGITCVAELVADSDFEFCQFHGGTPEAVEARISLIINTVNIQFETEVGITHELTAIVARCAEPDPYTSNDAATLLSQFRSVWINEGGVQRDLAHLFTGRNLNGGLIGLGFGNGTVCTESGFSLSRTEFNGVFACATDLVAHQFGHMFGADHCDCPGHTMNGGVECANTFHPDFTIPEILAFRDAAECLDDCGGETCVADLNGDGVVDVSDLLIVLANFGGTEGDVNGDGVVDVADLLLVLSGWGDCI